MSTSAPFAFSTVNNAITSSVTLSSNYATAIGHSGNLTVGSITGASNTLQVNGDISVANGDLVIDGVSIKKLLEGVTERLHILMPDPDKLEKYESLKRAYEHYKLMEKLCYENKEN